MKFFVHPLIAVTLSLFLGCEKSVVNGLSIDESASYNVTIDVTWDNETHPTETFPNGQEASMKPHVSSIIGAVHSREVSLWGNGELASPALKRCAEDGSSAEMRVVVENYIAENSAKEVIFSEGMASPSTAILTVNADIANPQISFVSMIAPSPDWFFGVDNLSLIEKGQWIDTIVVDMYPYDAGTKDGEEYRYDFDATDPAQIVRQLKGVAPFSDLPVARVILTRE